MDPSWVSPAVVWLTIEEAGDVTGRVIKLEAAGSQSARDGDAERKQRWTPCASGRKFEKWQTKSNSGMDGLDSIKATPVALTGQRPVSAVRIRP